MGAVGSILGGVGALAGAVGGFLDDGGEQDINFVQPPVGPGVGIGTSLINQAGPFRGVNADQYAPAELSSEFYNQLGPAQQESLLRSGQAIEQASGLRPISGADISSLEQFIQQGANQRARNIVRAGQERSAAGGPSAAIRQGTAGALGGLDRTTAEALTRTRLAGQAQQFQQGASQANLLNALAGSRLGYALQPAAFEVQRGQAENQVQNQGFNQALAAEQLNNQARSIGAGLVTGGTPAPVGTVQAQGPGPLAQGLALGGGALAGIGSAVNQYQFQQQMANLLGGGGGGGAGGGFVNPAMYNLLGANQAIGNYATNQALQAQGYNMGGGAPSLDQAMEANLAGLN